MVTGALTLVRAGYGVGLVCVPSALLRMAGDVEPSARACGVARVLGVRHLVQAAITVAAERADPDSPAVLGGGAAVDLLHATSMLALGALGSQVRRTVLTDAAVETALAAASAWALATPGD